MAQPLILTFAEVEFALRVSGDRAATIRNRLRISPEAEADIVVAAGISSLLARGLATMDGDGTTPSDVVPTEEMIAVTATFADHYAFTEAAGWLVDRPAVIYILSGPLARLTLSPGVFGQFSVTLTDPAEPLGDVVDRFLDLCSVGEGESAVAIRSVEGDGEPFSIAVARDGSGTWRVSDSEENPETSQPTTREGIHARLTGLLPSRPATTG